MMITASAPLDGSVKSFIEIAFGCPMIEAYGLSESSGAICATSQEVKLEVHSNAVSSKPEIDLRCNTSQRTIPIYEENFV